MGAITSREKKKGYWIRFPSFVRDFCWNKQNELDVLIPTRMTREEHRALKSTVEKLKATLEVVDVRNTK